MASLAACIRKAGPTVNKEDVAVLKEIQQDYINDGLTSTNAAKKAIDDYLSILKSEKQELITQARRLGADVSAFEVKPTERRAKTLKREGEKDDKTREQKEGEAFAAEDPYAEFYQEALDKEGVGQSQPHSDAYERLISGKPTKLTHRTFSKFESFDDAKVGETTGTGTASLGHWLATVDVGDAKRYGDNVLEFEVKIDKPFIVDIDSFYEMGDLTNSELASLREGLMAQGFDAVVVDEIEHVAVFESKSISKAGKSITTERGIRFRPEEVEQINKAPDSPEAILSKFGGTMEAQAKVPKKTILQRVKDKYKDASTKTIRGVLATTGRRNLKDFAPKGMDAVAEYTRTAQRMDGERNELMTEYGDVIKGLNDFVSRNKTEGRVLGEMMHASTLAEVDPSVKYEKLHDDPKIEARREKAHTALKKIWDKMPPEAQEQYKKVRDTYALQRQRTFDTLKNRIEASDADGKVKKKLVDELRTVFEFGKKGPYFPLSRYGEYWAAVKDNEGEIIAFSKFEKVSQRDDWVSNFRKEGFTNVESGTISDDKTTSGQVDPGFVSKITKLTGGIKGDDGKNIADEIWQIYLKTLPEMSMRKAAIRRKGRLGYSADALRNLSHHMFHGSHQLARMKFVPELERLLEKAKVQAKEVEKSDAFDKNWAIPVYDELNLAHEAAMNPQQSAFAAMATSLGFTMFLGLTPAAAAVNLTQTAMVALPIIGAKFGYNKAVVELLKASKDWSKSTKPMNEYLEGDELKAFNEAYKIGLFERSQAHSLAGITEDGMELGQIHQRTMKYVSWMFHKAEEFNRQVTYISSYRLARKNGMSHEDAVLLAEDITWDSHFDYSTANRPRVMRGNASKVIMLFKQYSLNMSYRLIRDFNDGFLDNPNLSPEAKTEAKKRFAGMMVTGFTFAGMMGLPLAWVITTILDALLSTDDEPFDSETEFRKYLSELLGSDISEAIMDGPIDKITGVTVSSRVSLDLKEMWLRSPTKELEGMDNFYHYLGELAGPVAGGIPMNITKGLEAIEQGQTQRGIERLVPKAIADVLKSMRYLDEGAQNFSGQTIIPKESFSNMELFLQAIGFTPKELTMQYKQMAATKKISTKLKRRKTRLMDRLFLAYRNGDKEDIKEQLKNIRAFNKANPRIAIKTSSIVSSAKNRAKKDMRAVGGLALDKKLHYLHKKTKFTKRPEEKDE